MTKGRKPGVMPEGTEITVREDVLVVDAQALTEISIGQQMVMQYEEVIRQLGQIDSFEFMRRVADVATAQIFENVRKTGAYKGFPYIATDGRHATVASLDEFCEIKLGKSYRRCMDLSQNLRTLGPDLYEQSERLGLRNVDYKALRALPADDQEIIRQAIEEAKSRDEVLTILQEMAVKHATEKAELTMQAEGAKADYEALDKHFANTTQRADEAERELAKARHRVETETPDEYAAQVREEAGLAAFEAEAAILGKLRPAFAALDVHAQAHDCTHENFMSGLLAQIEGAIYALREKYAIKDRPDPDQKPEWVKKILAEQAAKGE